MLAVAIAAKSRNMIRAKVVAENALVVVLAVAIAAKFRNMIRAKVVAENALPSQQSLARQTGLTADRLDESKRSDQQQHRTHHTTNDPDL